LFKELVLVVGGVVVISLLVATTLTPLLTDRLLRGKERGQASGIARSFDKVIGFGLRGYERLLGICLRGKWLVVVIALVAFGTGLWLASHIGTQFLPKLDDGRIMVKLKMPSGTSVGEVNRILTRVENRLEGLPEIDSMFKLAGGRVFGLYTLEVGNEGNLNIQLMPRNKRDISTEQFIKKPSNKSSGMPLDNLYAAGLKANAYGLGIAAVIITADNKISNIKFRYFFMLILIFLS